MFGKSRNICRRLNHGYCVSYYSQYFNWIVGSVVRSNLQKFNFRTSLNTAPKDPIQTSFFPLFQRKRNDEEPVDVGCLKRFPIFEEKPSCVLPSSPERRDFLVEKYQFSCSEFDAKRLHLEIIRNGFVKDVFLCNTLLNIYVRVGNMGLAFHLFDEMLDRNLVTWACLISGCTHNEMLEKACETFQKMISSGFFPNHYGIGSTLRACQGLGASGLRFGLQIHGWVSKTRYGTDVVVCNVLISMYGSCMVSADYALHIFEDITVKNSISWNSIISVYSQREDPATAFKLFSTMQKVGQGFSFRPSEYTFGSLITAAASSSCTFLLDQMLAMVVKSGFSEDLYVGSALVSGYAKFGMLGTAKKIFKQMGTRNAASLNGLMVGLVRLNRGEEAFDIFMEMRDLIRITSDSLIVLLSTFPEFSSLEDGLKRGQELHGFVIRNGLVDSKVAVGNGLINMYSKCGAIPSACSVFKLMVSKDSVSWNSLIAGLDQNACYEDAVFTFSSMKRCGQIASNFTLISVLSACGSLGWIRSGEQVHSEGLKLGLDSDVSVSNALLSLYAETGHLNACKKVFALMPEYDQVSWNSIIGALNDSEVSAFEAIEYLKTMIQSGWTLNQVTFINILEAVSSLSILHLAHQVHALVLKYNSANDSSIENALLSCYGKSGGIDETEKIFSRMLGRRDEVSWNCMISSYIHNEQLPKALDLVWHILQNGERLDCFTLASVLSACASIATLGRGMEVHACAIRSCLVCDVVIGSALVDMYAKCGRIDYASRYFELMPVRNVYSWNSIITGYARHGNGHKALELFMRMKVEEESSPDHVTFIGVLSACSHVGLVDQGFDYFESMSKVYGLSPKMEHFSCMVDLLGRAGKLDKIEDFISRMPIEPNILIWRTVLGACTRANGHGTDLGLGRKAAQMLFQLEPQNAVNYVLLSNMHASEGKWENVADARHTMEKAALKKEIGCSWVTMKDGVHVFVAGDKSHPDKKVIYQKLRELHSKMKDAGYVPELKFALYDLEDENKEELLSYHSERIAVAFVLTRKSDLPIRIMKNLRICGDCHSAFNYISKIVGRQIILRDSNRFHHFSDGKCSCNDFW